MKQVDRLEDGGKDLKQTSPAKAELSDSFGENTRFSAFQSLSSRFQAFTFHSSPFQFTFTTQEGLRTRCHPLHCPSMIFGLYFTRGLKALEHRIPTDRFVCEFGFAHLHAP